MCRVEKDEAGKVGWKYIVKVKVPDSQVMILHWRQWETMAKM